MKKKFSCKSARVKGLSFHPSRPWIITSLHTGLIQIWDYNMSIVIAKFQDHQGPVRGISFHHTLPLFVSGGDDSFVKVFNYKQKRCLFTLKGHIDYIRTVSFHHQLPWILSSSDDQTMRIWNYQSRQCINIITGHSHYVMCAQFHPQKNFIVSCSLDCTVRIWDFTVLKKKLTESKNLSGFVGIQIQCIKILEGHQKGVDWVCFHPTQNIIASSADDKKIKLWKYTTQVAWEHSTISGHAHNVSNVIFDPKTGNLISNSQDCTTKIWNIQTKNPIVQYKRHKQRYWVLAVKKNGSLVASGHDSGFDIFYLNKQKIPHCVLQQNLVIFAQGMKTFIYDPEKKIQKQQLYQYNPKSDTTHFFIQRITVNKFCPTHFMVQIKQSEKRSFILKKKENYLNFPYVMRQYEAKDSCYVSKTHVATLQSPQQINFFNYIDKQDRNKNVLKVKQNIHILRIFSSDKQNVLIFVTTRYIAQYNVLKNQMIAQEALETDTDVRKVVIWKNKIAILGKFQVIITDSEFNRIATIHQKFQVQSAFWQSDQILFYTTNNHWKYALMSGQTGIVKTIQQPLHLLNKISNSKFLAFSQTQKVFQIQCANMYEIEFKLAISEKKWDKVRNILKNVGSNNRSLLGYLVQKGYAHVALDLVQNPQQKFALAIQSTNFQMAFQICRSINTQDYWKMLGDEALKQGIYEAYEVSCQKQKNYDKLNFLYSLQGNTDKLQKMITLTKKNPMLAFNASLFLNNNEQKQNILRDIGLQRLAALSVQAQSDASQHSEFLKKMGSRPLQIVQIEKDQKDFSNWPHTINEEQDDN